MKKTVITKVTVEVSISDLFYFLEEKGYLQAFLTAYAAYCTDFHIGTFKCNTPLEWIAVSFIWENTKEGVQFWGTLNEEWKNYLKENLSEEELRHVEWKVKGEKEG